MEVCCSLITVYHGFNGFGPNRGGDHTGETPTTSLKATNSISEFSRPENSKMEVCCSLITVYHGFNGFGPDRGGDHTGGSLTASLKARTPFRSFRGLKTPKWIKMEVCCSLMTVYHGFNGFGLALESNKPH